MTKKRSLRKLFRSLTRSWSRLPKPLKRKSSLTRSSNRLPKPPRILMPSLRKRWTMPTRRLR
jgi:hypothetical protein